LLVKRNHQGERTKPDHNHCADDRHKLEGHAVQGRFEFVFIHTGIYSTAPYNSQVPPILLPVV